MGTVTVFLSTPSVRRATHYHCHRPDRVVISIHALREEGDAWAECGNHSHNGFLSTPSARRATHKLYHTTYFNHAFLSTPSARRATFWVIRYLPPLIYFYPRPPRGGRLPDGNVTDYLLSISIHALREEGDGHGLVTAIRDVAISIHALREEGDGAGLLLSTCKQLFLSTPSARRATPGEPATADVQRISIHAG